jgi:hypothetical protein
MGQDREDPMKERNSATPSWPGTIESSTFFSPIPGPRPSHTSSSEKVNRDMPGAFLKLHGQVDGLSISGTRVSEADTLSRDRAYTCCGFPRTVCCTPHAFLAI